MKQKINPTEHAEKLFRELGYVKEKTEDIIWFIGNDVIFIGFDLNMKHVLVKKMHNLAIIDISTLKAINSMVYELGWYKK